MAGSGSGAGLVLTIGNRSRVPGRWPARTPQKAAAVSSAGRIHDDAVDGLLVPCCVMFVSLSSALPFQKYAPPGGGASPLQRTIWIGRAANPPSSIVCQRLRAAARAAGPFGGPRRSAWRGRRGRPDNLRLRGRRGRCGFRPAPAEDDSRIPTRRCRRTPGSGS